VIQETFVISQLEEDAILGMPFLKRHGCRIDLLMAGKELTYVNKSACTPSGRCVGSTELYDTRPLPGYHSLQSEQ